MSHDTTTHPAIQTTKRVPERNAQMNTRAPQPHPRELNDTNGNLVQPTPYYVQASCELSEDYFLTADVLIGPDDKVVPFVNYQNGNAIEAIVLSAGVVHHLHRDPTTTSGWVYDLVPIAMSSSADVAVAATPTGVLVLALAPNNPDGTMYSFLNWLTGPATWGQGKRLGPGSPVTLLRGGASPDSTPYFYGWIHEQVKSGKTTYDNYTMVSWLCNATEVTSMRALISTQAPTSDQQSVLDAICLYDTANTAGPANGYAAVLTYTGSNPVGSQQSLSVYQQEGTSFSDTVVTTQGGVQSLLWAYTSPGSTTGQPGLLWQDQDGNVAFLDETGAQTTLYDGGAVGGGAVAAWQLAGEYTFTLLDDGQANVVSQVGTGSTSSFTASIPLIDGVAKIYSFPTDPAQSTLFTVFGDTTLNVLTKDPVLGWTQTQVHQENATLQEVQSWRAQISILDANGAGVAGAQATVQSDRLVGLWQPSGNTILEPGSTITMTADYGGRITVTIPAEELDTAVLTVQALDGDGHPTGKPFEVTPDIDVQNFLAGQGSLTDTGMLTGAGLLAAKNSSGAAVFPNLASAADPADGANQAAQAINHVAQLGLGYQPQTSTDVQSAVFDLTGATPSFQSSTNPNAFSSDIQALDAKRCQDAQRLGGGENPQLSSVSDWWHSVEHDAKSAFHGLRHGAIEFKKMVSSWDADAKNWAVSLIVDIGDGLDNLMTYIISDVTTAMHAISGFFQALGADIKAGIDWLKHHVIALLREAEANAKVIEGWFTQAIGTTDAPGPFVQVVNNLDVSTQGFFDNLAREAHEAITDIETAVEDVTFGSAAPLPPATNDTGSNDADLILHDAGEFAKFLHHCSGNWLLDKILHHLPADPGPSTVPNLTPVVDDLATVFVDVISLADSIWQLFETSLEDVINPAAFSQLEMTTWFGMLDNSVDDTVKVLEAIAETVIALMKVALDWVLDTLSYEIQILPSEFRYTLIGQIFRLAGIDPTLSVSHLIGLVAAYPATLIHALHGSGPLFPASTTGAAGERISVGDSNDGWATGLGFTAAVVQGIWGFNDVIVDLQTATNEDGSKASAPSFCDWIDIFAPLVLCIAQWPSAQDDGNTGPPFYGFIDTSSKYDWMLPWIIASGIFPSLMALVQKRTAAVAGTNEPAPDSVADPLANYYGPIVQMICGIVNTTIGTAFNVKTDADAAAIAGGVLGNLSYMLAVFMESFVNEAAEDIPVLIKTLFDATGNVGAAVCIAEATTLPPR